VTGQLVHAVADRLGDRRVGPQVRAALLLGHHHARLGVAVEVGEVQARLPRRRLRRIAETQGGRRRVVDRHRAARPGVELVHQVEEPGPDHVGAWPRVAPRQRADLALHAQAQHPQHRRVVLDLVHAVAPAVVLVQAREVALGAPAVVVGLLGGSDRAEVAAAVLAPGAALASQRVAQRRVGVERVVAEKRRRLVEDLVGDRRSATGCGGHARLHRRR
jgi:hypothetical protein